MPSALTADPDATPGPAGAAAGGPSGAPVVPTSDIDQILSESGEDERLAILDDLGECRLGRAGDGVRVGQRRRRVRVGDRLRLTHCHLTDASAMTGDLTATDDHVAVGVHDPVHRLDLR